MSISEGDECDDDSACSVNGVCTEKVVRNFRALTKNFRAFANVQSPGRGGTVQTKIASTSIPFHLFSTHS